MYVPTEVGDSALRGTKNGLTQGTEACDPIKVNGSVAGCPSTICRHNETKFSYTNCPHKYKHFLDYYAIRSFYENRSINMSNQLH